jgi:hypothetical protein
MSSDYLSPAKTMLFLSHLADIFFIISQMCIFVKNEITMKIIGRRTEQAALKEYALSNKPELVAV